VTGYVKILPGTVRGTMRSMVEGAHAGVVAHPFKLNHPAQRWTPSTAFGGPPPRAGEDLA
jgi:hypothetical protein